MKILVVDDELDICEILQYNLETEGYEVDTVNSAEEALALNLTEYALILLDVMMENMSGFQMAHKMKENPATSHHLHYGTRWGESHGKRAQYRC